MAVRRSMLGGRAALRFSEKPLRGLRNSPWIRWRRFRLAYAPVLMRSIQRPSQSHAGPFGVSAIGREEVPQHQPYQDVEGGNDRRADQEAIHGGDLGNR